MIHSMGGGVIREYDTLTYCLVNLDCGEKAWYISPFCKVAVGDRVEAEWKTSFACGTVLRVVCVTAQTAPYPVNRTRELLRILPPTVNT